MGTVPDHWAAGLAAGRRNKRLCIRDIIFLVFFFVVGLDANDTGPTAYVWMLHSRHPSDGDHWNHPTAVWRWCGIREKLCVIRPHLSYKADTASTRGMAANRVDGPMKKRLRKYPCGRCMRIYRRRRDLNTTTQQWPHLRHAWYASTGFVSAQSQAVGALDNCRYQRQTAKRSSNDKLMDTGNATCFEQFIDIARLLFALQLAFLRPDCKDVLLDHFEQPPKVIFSKNKLQKLRTQHPR